MIVVITGDFGQGRAKPINQMTGKSATCMLTAMRKASASGTWSESHCLTVSSSVFGGPDAVNCANFLDLVSRISIQHIN